MNDHGRLERKIELVQGHGYSGFFTAVEFAVAELIGHREPLHIQLMSLSVVVRTIDGERRIDKWSGVNVLAD